MMNMPVDAFPMFGEGIHFLRRDLAASERERGISEGKGSGFLGSWQVAQF